MRRNNNNNNLKNNINSDEKDLAFSLNPENDKKDNETAALCMKNPLIAPMITQSWFCALYSGDALRTQELSRSAFEKFLERVDFPNRVIEAGKGNQNSVSDPERALAEGVDAFDTQRRTRENLNFNGFVRASVKLAFSWSDARRRSEELLPFVEARMPVADRVEVVVSYAQEFLGKALKDFRQAHDVKGLGPDEAYINSREVDRLLYIYDDVFDRLFHRYKNRDQHQSRELTMEQNLVLDNFVELDEVREFLKDFGFFPKYISFVELSTCAQCACFGRIMVSPTKQLHARRSDIQENAAVKQFRDQLALQEVGDVTEEERAGVVNPLYLPSLPPEYLKDEPLLDKPRFMSCLVRIAQTLFNKNEFLTELPTIPARLEELFRVMQGPYDRIFGHPMQDDCDYTVPGIPILNCANGSATAVSPQEVRVLDGASGEDAITIMGSGFGEKRGVFVKFYPPTGEPVTLRASEVQKRRVVCAVPPIAPGEISMITEETKEETSIGVKFSARVYIECSNDRLNFSQTDPPQCFYCVRRTKPRVVDPTVAGKLKSTFSALCAIGTDVTNTKFMARSNWRRLKALYRVSERAFVEHEDGRLERQQDREIFFYQYAARHEAMTELSLDFANYLNTLCRSLYEEFRGKPGWFEKLAELAEIQFVPETKAIASLETVDNITKELRYAQQLLIDSEWRNLQEVDVFLGPVLCGCVTGRAGSVSSATTGTRVIHELHHSMLSYHHYDDVHSERILLQMAHVAQSYQQFLQRVVLAGFDIAAHHSNPQTRKPFGRCWSLIDEKSKRKVGVAWDYPGWFSSPAKLPSPHCLFSQHVTLTFYSGAEALLTIVNNGQILAIKDIPPKSNPAEGIQMLYGVLAHKRCTSISHMRSMLQPHGIVFVSKLYSLPK
jgi:hypothetical protein